MHTAKLQGAIRPDECIELTGAASDFRNIAQLTGLRLATIPLPGEPVDTPQHPLDRLIEGVSDWRRPKAARFALISKTAFDAAGLQEYVDFPRNPALPDEATAARKAGTLLKTLLLDRRDNLSLERMTNEITTRLGMEVSPEELLEVMAGALPIRPDLLVAMLITLHIHKALTPGHLAEFTGMLAGYLAGTPESGLGGLLKFPREEAAKAFYRRQLSITEDGSVTLAGVTVTPDITIFFPETESTEPERRWNNNYRKDGNLRQVSKDDKSQSAA